MKIHVPIKSHHECRQIYDNAVTDRMFCAGHPDGGKDFCYGDSGGPLALNGYVYGIVSWFYGDCGDEISVYTDVYAVKSWIMEQLRNNPPRGGILNHTNV